MFLVYKVTSPSNKVYVGITSESLSKRKDKHISCAIKNLRTGKFQKAIKKYKKELAWEVLENNLTKEEAIFLEKYYIKHYDSFINGYNCTLGGESNYGWEPSIETRQKISKALTGKKLSDSHKKSLKIGQKRYRSDNRNREKMAIERGAKPFLVYDMYGNFLKEYTCKSLCSEELKVERSNIRKVLAGLRNHTGGYKFIYKENFNGQT